jgi:hypothetical protein
MARDTPTLILLGAAVAIALVGVGAAVSSIATHRSFGGMMGGGMMGSNATLTDPGPGGLEWGILVASAILFLGAAAILYRARSTAPEVHAVASNVWAGGDVRPAMHATEIDREEPIPELSLMRLLDEDERRMYLEVRDHGGEMLQRDLVALGTFSKAKVTRVLDRLERKGLVVRERHGMTNRVRIVNRAGK